MLQKFSVIVVVGSATLNASTMLHACVTSAAAHAVVCSSVQHMGRLIDMEIALPESW